MRNIESRLIEIAKRATEWMDKFGVGGEIELVKGRKCEKKWFWGWGAWENPDFTFVYRNIEIGVFVQKYRAIRTTVGVGSFVEAKAFGKIIYLTHNRIMLPFSIDLALTFYPFFVTFLMHSLVRSHCAHLNLEKSPPSLIVDTRAEGEGIHFRAEIESADRASLWVNDNLVLQGNIIEVFRTYNRLIALSNL